MIVTKKMFRYSCLVLFVLACYMLVTTDIGISKDTIWIIGSKYWLLVLTFVSLFIVCEVDIQEKACPVSKTVIVITIHKDQVWELQMAIQGKTDVGDKIGQWPQSIIDYNDEWHWVIKDGKMQGSSGWNSLRNKIEQNPGASIYTFNNYDLPKQPLKH